MTLLQGPFDRGRFGPGIHQFPIRLPLELGGAFTANSHAFVRHSTKPTGRKSTCVAESGIRMLTAGTTALGTNFTKRNALGKTKRSVWWWWFLFLVVVVVITELRHGNGRNHGIRFFRSYS